MDLTIRPLTPKDADGKGYVHWKSWQETYQGLVDAGYLSRLTPEKCQEIARRRPENTLVAVLDGRIVGFSCYGASDCPNCGEVIALYVLREAQGLGIGRRLMDAALSALEDSPTVFLWVLKGNRSAIGFYEHYGFRPEGTAREIRLGAPCTELRMRFDRNI